MGKKAVRKTKTVKRNQRPRAALPQKRSPPAGRRAASRSTKSSSQKTKRKTPSEIEGFIAPLDCEKETHYPLMNLDGNLMAGTLHEPAKPSKALVIIIHGWKSSKEQTLIKQIAIDLARAGYAAYRIDLSGNGDSEGRFEDAVPSKLLRDISATVEHFRRRYGRIILLGHSLGGALSLITASRAKIEGLITIAGKMHPEDFVERKLTPAQHKDLLSVGFTTITRRTALGEIPYVITERFVQEIVNLRPLSYASGVLCPVLIIHAGEDKSSSLSDAQELFEVLKTRELLIIGGADHNFTNPQHLDAMIEGVVAWLRKLK